jgi:hypothetical protein
MVPTSAWDSDGCGPTSEGHPGGAPATAASPQGGPH